MLKIPSIYVFSATGFCGKTALCLGLALKFGDEGYKTGYFKPVCCETGKMVDGTKVDEDAQLMKEVLKLDLPLEKIVPLILDSRFLEKISTANSDFFQEKIYEAYEEVSQGKDLMILEGPCTPSTGASMRIDMMSIVKKIRSHLLMVGNLNNDLNVDEIIWLKKNCIKTDGIDILGVIISGVSKTAMERTKRFALPLLKKHDIDVIGITPDIISLRAPTVREICEKINCTILAAKDKLDNLVENFQVGAMTYEAALPYFRSSTKKAVITGGDRPRIQLAALETDTSVLILTGNFYPDIRVLAKAEESGVPVLLVPYDTYTTVTKMAAITGKIKPGDTEKIELAKKIVEDHIDWKLILNSLFP